MKIKVLQGEREMARGQLDAGRVRDRVPARAERCRPRRRAIRDRCRYVIPGLFAGGELVGGVSTRTTWAVRA